MNKQAQVFARQVQLDLLAIPDAVLFQTIHSWVNGANGASGASSGSTADVSAEARFALGYRLIRSNGDIHLRDLLAENTFEPEEQWLAPSLPELRQVLTDMDVKLFVQYILPLAFQSLHASHPDWDEGATFNAHLANHLRLIGGKQRPLVREPGEKEVIR